MKVKELSKSIIVIIVAFSCLSIIAGKNYLFFHTVVELASVVIAASVFTVTWNVRKNINNYYLLIVGIAFLFIGILDLLHTITYHGMNILPGNNYYANQFWIATRFLEALTIVFSFSFIHVKRKFEANTVFGIYFLITSLIVLSILYWKNFPVCYVEGVGQTRFKIYAEYVIIAVLIWGLYLLYRNRNYFDKNIYRALFGSVVFAILSEMCFTLYVSNYDIFNQLGHYAKLVTFYLIYKANVRTGFIKPAETLFKTIKDSEEKYRALSDTLAAENKRYILLNEEYKNQNKLLEVNETRLKELNVTKDKFFSIIAHDLKNMLTPITMYSSLLSQRVSHIPAEKIASLAESINQASRQAYTFFENLLEWSRLQLGHLSPRFDNVSISGFFQEVEMLTTQMANLKNIQLYFHIDEDSTIWADREMIKTVLLNLVINAIKFSHPGGAVTIKAKREHGITLFSITDTGIGISQEDIQKLFKLDGVLTRKGTANEKGTGLGLMVCAEFIEKNKGKIWAESTLHEGSCFMFSLPASTTFKDVAV